VGNYSTGKSVRWLKNFLIAGTAIFLKSPTLFYLFSKVIPVIGKYVPVLAGFSSSRKTRAVLLFSLGDVAYALAFTIGGFYLGDLFIEYSGVLAVVIALLFVVFYLLAARIYGKRIKSRMGKERSDYR
jgi:membrane protein DedA with SNARE-associated domain